MFKWIKGKTKASSITTEYLSRQISETYMLGVELHAVVDDILEEQRKQAGTLEEIKRLIDQIPKV